MGLVERLIGRLSGDKNGTGTAQKKPKSNKSPQPPVPSVEDGGDCWIITIPTQYGTLREFDRRPHDHVEVRVGKEARSKRK